MTPDIYNEKITPDSDTSVEDAIGGSIFGQTPPDIRPLVRLLRSGRPVPAGTWDMLVEMLDPDSDGYLNMRLELKDCSTKTTSIERLDLARRVTIHYRTLMKSGEKSQVAALDTGAKFGISDGTVYRLKRDWEAHLRWLKGR